VPFQLFTTPFPTNTSIARQLLQVGRLIYERGRFGMKRQIFFVQAGGYDTHSNQAQQFSANLLATAANIRAFWRDIELRGLADRVVIAVWDTASADAAVRGVNGAVRHPSVIVVRGRDLP
jgi:uncharacterized protein (DUF1501 family)